MFTPAFKTLLYEIAVRSLPRVCLKERPGVVGLILDTNEDSQLIHWGVADGHVVQTWVRVDELEDVL